MARTCGTRTTTWLYSCFLLLGPLVMFSLLDAHVAPGCIMP